MYAKEKGARLSGPYSLFVTKRASQGKLRFGLWYLTQGD